MPFLSINLIGTVGLDSTLAFSDYAVFGGYMALSMVLGLMAGGKQKDLKSYLLAGHQMHWAMIAISVLAALFSGVSFLGAPAETYNHNLIYLWAILAYFVATPITTLIVLPFFFRLDFYTAYEYLEHRFNLRLRRLSSAIFIFRVTLWLALAQYAPSLVIAEMMGIPLWAAIAITGGCTIVYTVAGGMKAVIFTDVMQFVVLIGGIIAVLCIAMGKIPGGLAGAWQGADAGGKLVFLDLSLSTSARMTVWGAFFGGIFINLIQLVTDQVSVQRYLTAKSLKESQKALWFKLWLTLPLVSLFYITGVVLYAFYQAYPEAAATLKSPDRLLPHFVIHQVAAPMPGLLVAAILAATMSTVSAGINSLTTATLIDFLYTRRGEAAGETEEAARVRTARLWTLIYGVIAAALALVVERLGSLVEASNKIGGFLGGPLLGIFFLGMLSRRANAQGTLIGAVAGFLAVLYVGFYTDVSFMWYAFAGCIATYIAGEIASRFFPEPDQRQKSFIYGASAEAELLPPPARPLIPADHPIPETATGA